MEGLEREAYVYQRINTMGHKPLYIDQHLQIAGEACRKLFPATALPSEDDLIRATGQILYRNCAHRGGNLMMLRIFPGGKWMLAHQKPMLYPGYALWHSQVTAVAVRDEHLWRGLPTSVSIAAETAAALHAATAGAGIALLHDHDGIVTGAGDNPVMAFRGPTVITTSVANGATDSLERRIMLWLCAMSGFEADENRLTVDQLPHVDEVLVFNAQGLLSVHGFGPARYFNTKALRLERSLPELSKFR